MKWGKITFLMLLLNFTCFSQEICNNAIDDDGDGLIDLNDTDCLCNTANSSNNTVSYIPNPSFEDNSLCPSAPSQLSYANNWSQCTMATADYLNTCGLVLDGITDAGLLPFPDGNAIAGLIFSNDWKEYIGIELTTVLEAEKHYQMTFNVASLPVNGDGETCNNGIINYSAADITLYGSANANSMPVNTTDAPTASNEWVVIGTVNYQPVAEWGQLTISFIPHTSITAVMIGPPATLPSSYTDNTCYPYFLFDNLILNESSAAEAAITAAGSFCSGDLKLAATTSASISSNAVYQWYKEGIAIAGANSNIINVPSNDSMTGEYLVRITDENNCITSTPYTVTPTMPVPVVTMIQPNCNNGTGIITVAATAAQYSFNNGVTWSSHNISQPLEAGTHFVKARSHSGCESIAVPVVITLGSTRVPEVSDVEYCQYSAATPLTAEGSNLLWYASPIEGTGSPIAPVPSTNASGWQTYYVTQTINGCESTRAALNVYINAAPLMPVSDEVVYYCQYSESAPLTASGTNLLWYTVPSGGTGKTEAPVPFTHVPGSFMYYVSQVQNGCESNRRLITVIVLEAPQVPETKQDIVFGQGEAAGQLAAYGENITWYDVNGRSLPAAPAPDTSIIGTTSYFVSQFINGCESAKIEIVVEVTPKNIAIKYPKFFTPNGDGQHEQWNISLPDNNIAGNVYIYDRQGLMVRQLKTSDIGWDGTFNGRPLPATDYWFKVVYNEYGVEREFTSHFSLVR